MEKTEGNLHWQIVQNLMEGFDEDRALTEIADDICSLLSQHIKAKALKDEELIEAINSPYGKNMYEQVTKGDRAVAARPASGCIRLI